MRVLRKFRLSLRFFSVLIVLMMLVLSSFTTSENSLANSLNPRKKFRKAMTYFNDQNYYRALPLLLELLAKNPENNNINFYVGVSYLNTANQSMLSIPYLELAAQKTKKDYENYYNQEYAPVHACYFLGQAYENNSQYDKAIECYEKYKKFLTSAKYRKDVVEVNDHISTCLQAKKRSEEQEYFTNKELDEEAQAIAQKELIMKSKADIFAQKRLEEEQRAKAELEADIAAAKLKEELIRKNGGNKSGIYEFEKDEYTAANTLNADTINVDADNMLLAAGNETLFLMKPDANPGIQPDILPEFKTKLKSSEKKEVANQNEIATGTGALSETGTFAENNFYVQVAAGRRINTSYFDKLSQVVFVCDGNDGIKRYICGSFTDYQSASEFRKQVVELGYSDAWIVQKGPNYFDCGK